MRNKQILEMMNDILGETMSKKQTAKLKNWEVEKQYGNYYVLTGEIFDHPRQED